MLFFSLLKGAPDPVSSMEVAESAGTHSQCSGYSVTNPPVTEPAYRCAYRLSSGVAVYLQTSMAWMLTLDSCNPVNHI